jgi:hypothetical protein
MACGGCRKKSKPAIRKSDYDFTGGVDIKSLNDRQIKARLEAFKRRFCNDCGRRYECDYSMYLKCNSL